MTKPEAIAALVAVIRRKHLALATEDNYSHWLGRFFDFLRHHPGLLVEPAARMEAFLTAEAKRGVAAATQNQAFNALLFWYREVLRQDPGQVDSLRAKKPVRLRHAPSVAAVSALLSRLQDSPSYPFRLIGAFLYGCGLRVTEPLNIRHKDLDLDAKTVIIRGAKGGKDRAIVLPDCLLPAIRRQVEASRVVHSRAAARSIPVKLPDALGTKYPTAGFSLGWWWLFPAPAPCADPRTGRTVWWRCHESAVQKAVRRAAQAAGIADSISPHHLRHAWATHAHAAGASVRDLQAILGHKSLETTMVYLHPEADRVTSPLEAIRFTA